VVVGVRATVGHLKIGTLLCLQGSPSHSELPFAVLLAWVLRSILVRLGSRAPPLGSTAVRSCPDQVRRVIGSKVEVRLPQLDPSLLTRLERGA